jgi:hypothetical protein
MIKSKAYGKKGRVQIYQQGSQDLKFHPSLTGDVRDEIGGRLAGSRTGISSGSAGSGVDNAASVQGIVSGTRSFGGASVVRRHDTRRGVFERSSEALDRAEEHVLLGGQDEVLVADLQARQPEHQIGTVRNRAARGRGMP